MTSLDYEWLCTGENFPPDAELCSVISCARIPAESLLTLLLVHLAT